MSNTRGQLVAAKIYEVDNQGHEKSGGISVACMFILLNIVYPSPTHMTNDRAITLILHGASFSNLDLRP